MIKFHVDDYSSAGSLAIWSHNQLTKQCYLKAYNLLILLVWYVRLISFL